MVGLYWTFNSNWYVILAIPFVIWAAILIYRKGYKNSKEIRIQAGIGIVGMVLGMATEYIAVNMNVWHYTDGDWPITVWFMYLLVAFSGYQIIKLLEDRIK